MSSRRISAAAVLSLAGVALTLYIFRGPILELLAAGTILRLSYAWARRQAGIRTGASRRRGLAELVAGAAAGFFAGRFSRRPGKS